jgi:hypothetical protein
LTTDIITTIQTYLKEKKNNPFGQRIYKGYPKLENLTPILGIQLMNLADPLHSESKGLGIAYEWNIVFTMFFKQNDENLKEAAIRFILTSMDSLDRTKYICQETACSSMEDGNTVQVTLDMKLIGK